LTARIQPADFEVLYRHSRSDVYAFVAGVLRDRSAAEEVTSVAFERAFRARDRFDPAKGNPRAWVFGIARNAAYDELRRRKRVAEMPADPEDRTAATPFEVAEAGVRREIVLNAMTSLSDRERELVVLKFHAGLSHEEIGQTLGVSPTNASTMLHRALTKMRKACREPA